MNIRSFISESYKLLYTYRNILSFLFISYALTKFFYLNYLNWDSGYLCTGYGGIQYGSDAKRYIEGAESLIKNEEISSFRKGYIGYMAIIAIGKLLGLGLTFTLVIQIIATLLSSIALYDIVKTVTNSRAVGVIGMCCYLTNPFIVTWVLFIHTESLYASMLLILAWAIYRAIDKQNTSYYFISLLLLLLTATLRPSGWMMVPVSIIFFVHYSKLKLDLPTRYFISVSALTIFIFVINYSPWFSKQGENEKVNEVMQNGTIICDPETYHLSMPHETPSGNNMLSSSFVYILKHPIAFVKLASLRIGSELLPLYRPWLSPEYILRFLIWMIPPYTFTIIGSLFFRKDLRIKLVLSIISAHLLIIALTFSEREFRFLVHILPLFYITGSCGFYIILKRAFSRFFKTY